MNVILFGAGKMLYEFLGEIKNYAEFHIIYIADNNENLWNKKVADINIINPLDICDVEYDYIIITSSYYKEIYNQLLDMRINNKKIRRGTNVVKEWYAKQKYEERYSRKPESRDNCFNLNKVVIYTAVLGDYDELKNPLYVDKKIDYVCFTNNTELTSDIWHMVNIDVADGEYRRYARKLKMSPHILFPQYETSIWVDAKFLIKADLRSYIEKYQKNKPILCFPHFERNCIYEEGKACIKSGRGKKEAIERQLEQYYKQGYPSEAGLYETGCLVRKHNNLVCQRIMNDWDLELKKYSLRDQISFPYVCWKNEFLPDICDLNILENEWLIYTEHKRDY